MTTTESRNGHRVTHPQVVTRCVERDGRLPKIRAPRQNEFFSPAPIPLLLPTISILRRTIISGPLRHLGRFASLACAIFRTAVICIPPDATHPTMRCGRGAGRGGTRGGGHSNKLYLREYKASVIVPVTQHRNTIDIICGLWKSGSTTKETLPRGWSQTISVLEYKSG